MLSEAGAPRNQCARKSDKRSALHGGARSRASHAGCHPGLSRGILNLGADCQCPNGERFTGYRHVRVSTHEEQAQLYTLAQLVALACLPGGWFRLAVGLSRVSPRTDIHRRRRRGAWPDARQAHVTFSDERAVTAACEVTNGGVAFSLGTEEQISCWRRADWSRAWRDGVTRYHVSGSGCCTISKDGCLLYTSPSPRDGLLSRMPSSA